MTSAIEVIVAAVANSLWQAVAAVGLAWIGLRYAPRMNAATRHLVWWAVLGAIVLMPAASWMAPTRTRPISQPKFTNARALVGQALPPAVLTFTRQAEGPALPKPVRAGRWLEWIFAAWFAVFLTQLVRIAWSYRHLQGIKRRAWKASPELRRDFDVWIMACGIHRPAQLLISREIVSPMAMGFRTPAVIVPEGLLGEFNENELDHVLLHELAHIARRDDWSNLTARIGWAFLALHPAAAWVLRQIEHEREIACDDWVVAATGEARPYAASLARLFELCFTRRRLLLATGMAERSSQLGDRIEMLLRRRREFSARVSLARIAAFSVVLMILLVVAARTPRWVAFAQTSRQQTANQVQARRPVRSAPSSGGSFLAALVSAGYGNLPVDDIIALKQSGITADFLNGLSESGWGKLPPGELMMLRNHGVTPEYLRAMKESGLSGIAVNDLVSLRAHGVDARYVSDIQSAGLGKYSVEQVIQFHQHGVNPELLRALKDYGFRDVEAQDVIQLRDHGVQSHSLGEARHYSSNLTLKQIIRLKQAGVI